jgi:cobalamin biosynthesis protein CobC
LRLGFVLGGEGDIAALSVMAGPWPVSGAAIAVGRRALLDRDWAKATAIRLDGDCLRLDAEVKSLGWCLVGGTPLFRLYETEDGRAAQERLAGERIWSRKFEQQPGWLRLGLPGDEAEWARLAGALAR